MGSARCLADGQSFVGEGATAETLLTTGLSTGLGGARTLEAKRRELRDSEAFSSSGEMFTNMSLRGDACGSAMRVPGK